MAAAVRDEMSPPLGKIGGNSRIRREVFGEKERSLPRKVQDSVVVYPEIPDAEFPVRKCD
jgi:hypothetical protein